MSQTTTAAANLEGLTLAEGWSVEERFDPGPAPTGGHFSYGYRVRHEDGRQAFLKALDYSAALRVPNTAQVLLEMTNAFIFEVELLRLTADRRMSRIVRAVDDGETEIKGASGTEKISYLIFELADGDVRRALDTSDRIDVAWKLRSLHHVATGLRQLHSEYVAHQDLKPSNVLVFEGNSSKIGDLGRAAQRGTASPFDDLPVAGDLTYAPPELLYGSISADWACRRQACDLYHLGSLAVFLFAGASLTSLLIPRLLPEHRPEAWGDSYEAVLPFVRDAFDRAIEAFEATLSVRPEIAADLVSRVRELSDPDPHLRGHPLTRARADSPYSLERYVAAFDLLSKRAEAHAFASPEP